MSLRRAAAGGLAALVLTAAAACGGAGPHVPDATRIPLVPGARVVEQTRQCDRGASAYCAVELVVVGPDYHSERDFLLSERAHLHSHGWTGAKGDIGDESAADSPGHKLHLIYATASGELKGIDLAWIKRPRVITLALSRALFDRHAALAMMLEIGANAT